MLDKHDWTFGGERYIAVDYDAIGGLSGENALTRERDASGKLKYRRVLDNTGSAGAEILRLAARVRELEERRPLTPLERIAADRLADEVASLVSRRLLDSRSAAADALLDYREPPRSPRSDRLAELEERIREQDGGFKVANEENDRHIARIVALEAEAKEGLEREAQLAEQLRSLAIARDDKLETLAARVTDLEAEEERLKAANAALEAENAALREAVQQFRDLTTDSNGVSAAFEEAHLWDDFDLPDFEKLLG